MKLSCIVVTYNRDDFIGTCIESLEKSNKGDLEIEIIVIDNGSPDQTEEAVKRYPYVRYIRNSSNIPLPKVLNSGLELLDDSDTDFILVLNDDIEMQDGAIEEMVEVCLEQPKSIVSPLQINYRKPDLLDGGMLDIVRKVDLLIEDTVYRKKPQRYYDLPTIIGAAMLATKKAWDELGNFDDNFDFYGIDDDYCKRAQFHGYRLLLALNSHMYHAHGKDMPKVDSEVVKVDKAGWLRRWKSTMQARMLFRLKNPKQNIAKNYFDAGLLCVETFFLCSFRGFFVGAWYGITTYVGFIKNRKRIMSRRVKDFKMQSS